MADKAKHSQAVKSTEFVSLGAYPGGTSLRISMRHNGKIERHSSFLSVKSNLEMGLDWQVEWHRRLAGIERTQGANSHDVIELYLDDEAIVHFKKLSDQVQKAYAKFQAKGGLEAQSTKHEISVRLRRIKKNLLACYEHGLTDEKFDEFVHEVKAEALLKS